MKPAPTLRPLPGGRERAEKTPRDAALVVSLERAVVGGLLVDPAQVDAVLELLAPADFSEAALRPVLGALSAVRARGERPSLLAVVLELDARGELQAAGGAERVAELFDESASAADVVPLARRLKAVSLERALRRVHDERAEAPRDVRLREEAEALEEQLQALEAGPPALAVLGFTGARLEALRARPQPASPLPGLLDPLPGLILLQGRPKSGKTTLALALAQAWAQGVAPWPGAPDLPGTRAFVLSAEQPAMRIDATLRRLDLLAHRGSRAAWTERVTVLARDADLAPAARRMLELDREGVAALREALLRARDAGDPFGFGVLDSLSRLKPAELDENSADEMTGWLGALQQLAEDVDAHLALVHHQGYAGRDDAVGASRGSSAIGAVAPTLWLLGVSAPRQRTLKIQGNALEGDEIVLEVAGETASAGALNYFRPVDPQAELAGALDELLAFGETVSTRELALRLEEQLTGKRPERESGKTRTMAAQLRERWKREGRVVVTENGRGRQTTLERIQ